MAVAPSNLLTLTSDIMSRAQARLRELAMASTNLDTINALIAKREAIDAQQRRIMRANLVIIDQDPAVQKNIDQLTQLAGELAAGVREMRNVTNAIKAATDFISVAEKILPLFALV
jgi:hypothetical protein